MTGEGPIPLSVASIGECMIELSSSGPDGAWRLGYAGDTFNTLWTMKALIGDGVADYVSAFGDDPFSRRQIDFMNSAGIGIATSPIISGARPGLYAITLDGAERSFTYWRSDAAARSLAADAAALAQSLEGRSLVYFSGITLAILDPGARANLFGGLATARENGALIAFDPNYRPRLWPDVESARAAINDALKISDIALPTFPDEQMLCGDVSPAETAARLARIGVPEIVVKDGANPALVIAEGVSEFVPALSVEAVDTTGAGDSFNAGYLAARLAGEDPVRSAVLAHRVAGVVVRVRGALAPVATLKAAFDALDNQAEVVSRHR